MKEKGSKEQIIGLPCRTKDVPVNPVGSSGAKIYVRGKLGAGLYLDLIILWWKPTQKFNLGSKAKADLEGAISWRLLANDICHS